MLCTVQSHWLLWSSGQLSCLERFLKVVKHAYSFHGMAQFGSQGVCIELNLCGTSTCWPWLGPYPAYKLITWRNLRITSPILLAMVMLTALMIFVYLCLFPALLSLICGTTWCKSLCRLTCDYLFLHRGCWKLAITAEGKRVGNRLVSWSWRWRLWP